MRLGELIAIARECKGWTLRDLEKVSGVSNALISQIETNKVKDPGFKTVVRIVDALGILIERAAATMRPPPCLGTGWREGGAPDELAREESVDLRAQLATAREALKEIIEMQDRIWSTEALCAKVMELARAALSRLSSHGAQQHAGEDGE